MQNGRRQIGDRGCVAIRSGSLRARGSMLTLTGGQIMIGITAAGIRIATTGVAAAWTVLRMRSIMLRCTNAQIVCFDSAAMRLGVAHWRIFTLLLVAAAVVIVRAIGGSEWRGLMAGR
jgi:hypothetical protein